MLFEIAENVKKEILKYSNEFEIYLEKEEITQLDLENTKLNFAKEEITFGIGIRVINDNKLGFAYTSDVKKIPEIAEKAFSNLKLNEKDVNFGFAEESKYPKVKGICDKNFKNLDLNENIEFIDSMVNTVLDEKCEPSSGGFSSSISKTLLINSNNVNVSNVSTGFSGYIAVNAEKNGEKSTAYDSQSSCIFDLNPVDLAESVCKLAKNSIGGEKIETRDQSVILDYHAAAGLLNTFILGFNADNVQRGRSALGKKLNQNVASPNLSIYDDTTYKGGLSSSICDGEGTPSEKTVLVEKGLLKGFIHNIYTANKSNVKSTANGFRSSYADTPSCDSSNVVFDFANKIDVSELDNGFLATDVLGAHTANPISGDFSVESNNSFLIENGEITKPIKKAMISGNIFEALSNCDGIKSEKKQYGSFIGPKILCKSLRIVG
jgi:PmbA protein